MKPLAFVMLLMVVLTGCSKATVVNELISKDSSKFNVYVFNNAPAEEFNKKFDETITKHKNVVAEFDKLVVGFDRDSKRASALNITKFPTIVVFDSKGVKLETQKIEDLDNLLNSN